MKKLNSLLVIGLVVLGLILSSFGCAAPKPAPTAPTEVLFEGKTITIVCPYSPGGGTDILGRVVAKHLPKYLPGKPTMIVRNMAGAGGFIGTDYGYNAKPDGLTLVISTGTPLMAQLLEMKGVHFDLRKMPVFMATSVGIQFYTKPTVVGKVEDILKAKGIIYGSMTGSIHGMMFCATKELIGFPVEKFVMAYGGTADARRAFFAGEINLTADTVAGYREMAAPYVERGEVVPLFQSGILDEQGNVIKDPGLSPEILTIKELYEKLYGKSPSGKAWEALRAMIATRAYDKGFHLPPGTPDGIVRVYWDASEKMLKDPEFREVKDRVLGAAAPWSAGEATGKGFKLNVDIKPEVRDWLRNTLTKYGVVIE